MGDRPVVQDLQPAKQKIESLEKTASVEPPNLLDILSREGASKDKYGTFVEAWKSTENKSKSDLVKDLGKLSEKSGESVKESVADRIGAKYAERLLKMIDEKDKSDIPAEKRLDASKVIKPGKGIEAGKLNTITLPDGRQYDLYIPKTVHAEREGGKLSVPTLVAVHGAETNLDEDARHMKDATGLNQLADRMGFAVIYPRAKARMFKGVDDPETGISRTGKIGEMIDKKFNTKPVLAWNTHDNDLLPSDASYNDINYLDNVLKSAGSLFAASKQVGIMGHSDGGRFSQIYTKHRPENVAALATFTSTWMREAEAPEVGKPTRIILGDKDKVLNIDGKRTAKSSIYDFILPTNMEPEKQSPRMQGEIWSEAGGCTDKTVSKSKLATVEKYSGGPKCDVEVSIVHGNGHAVPSFRNLQKDGSYFSGKDWIDGYGSITKIKQDTRYDYSYDVSKWMMGYLTKKK